MLKWGWVQFLATWLLVAWSLSWLEGAVFVQRVLPTRVVSDIQPRAQRY
jgi:transmembrane protein 231